ncbi:transcription factor BIM1-like isoform X2 [Ipomoea triloba]|uniref:transcription factor BIM1-like isoform X2 n=1 Tax=Ipomoea triloba TaxID=35885 RepID=UPI00125D9FEA|nr:transcription factor BIM1-like isoform X2 [Ipomoea triloba]
MELPQPRAFGTEGRKTTHDFLSLYSSLEQDPRPPQGGFVRTHDFLQPLEGAGKTVGKEEIDEVEMRGVEKPLPPAPAVEPVLPGGIGTYSISYLHQRAPKPEGSFYTVTDTNDVNSDYSSCTRTGFTVWNESTLKKDNSAGDFRAVLRETGMNKGGGPQLGRPSQTPSNLKNKTATFSSFLASQQFSEQNNQSFLNMIASSKSVREDDGNLEEEEFVIKKEQSLHPRGNLPVKVDEKSSDQKPNTPRSKHSAIEQRRRSKINDRFQMLRGIIPHSDQKRDKASFLLEVIEYIQFLQEKVHKYEGSYQGWDNETSKLPWSKCHSDAQGYIDHSQGKKNVSGPALMLAAKFAGNRPGISLPIPISEQNIESNMNLACPKENGHQSENNEKPVSLPNAFPFCGTSNTVAQHSPKLALGGDASTTFRHQFQCSSDRSHITSQAVASDKSKDEDLTVESGTISISSMYSQGLLNTLTKALENSGVDLSQASISVHVDLGKRSNGRLNNSSASTLKGDDVSTSNQPMPHSITSTSQGKCDQAQKRLKTSRG